ncbi:hypothetical protein emb_1d0417 [Coriobacteriaceae bacterium EMTCatB1]|nr:hypothetical protein emb_1d0417 [Coriobacteriaceae bacterium EMTCatB1]
MHFLNERATMRSVASATPLPLSLKVPALGLPLFLGFSHLLSQATASRCRYIPHHDDLRRTSAPRSRIPPGAPRSAGLQRTFTVCRRESLGACRACRALSARDTHRPRATGSVRGRRLPARSGHRRREVDRAGHLRQHPVTDRGPCSVVSLLLC